MCPAPWMVVKHLRGDAEDGHVEAILKQGVELRHAVHGMFDDRHVWAGVRKCVGHFPTGGEFKYVCDSYSVLVGSPLHPLGQFEQLPSVVEKVFAPDGESNVAAVAHKKAYTELVLKLADLLRKCRLAEVELGRGPAKVKLLRHHYEVAHQPQVEVHTHPLACPVA